MSGAFNSGDDAISNKPPFDVVRGAFIILAIIVLGAIAQSGLISAGCFYAIETLCAKGSGVKDIVLEIIAMVAILLNASRPPTNKE